MRTFAALVLLLVLLGASPSAAHQPYFGRWERMTLPDGRTGQIGIVYGDGILAADPSRVVIVGPDNRLLARSHRGRPMARICDRGTCVGYDSLRLQVLDPDPSSFLTAGPLVSPDAGEEDIWGLEDRSDEPGFRRRSAWPLEILRGEFGHAQDHPAAVLTLAALAIAATRMTALRKHVFRASPDLSWRLVFRVIAVLMESAAYGAVSLAALFAFGMVGVSFLTCAAALIGGPLLAPPRPRPAE